MKTVLTILGVILLVLMGCSSEPTRGSLSYQDRQVYMCRELCAAGTIEVHRIEGLECVCAPKKEPMIYNPIVTGGTPTSFVVPGTIAPVTELTQKPGATVVQDSTGRTIISQVK